MPYRNPTVFDQGWIAWADGALLSENPHVFTDEHLKFIAWSDGWHAACEDSEHEESEMDDYADRADWEYDKRRGE